MDRMMKTTSVAEALANVSNLAMHEVCLTGTLYVGEEVLLADDRDALERGEFVLVRDNLGICDRLLTQMPIYLGGSYGFADACIICGQILINEGKVELAQLKHCTVMRDEYVVRIP